MKNTNEQRLIRVDLSSEDAAKQASKPVPEDMKRQIMASGLPGAVDRFSSDLTIATNAVLQLAKLYAGVR